jgi:diguanylate cyclase (GGDEF)-like protein
VALVAISCILPIWHHFGMNRNLTIDAKHPFNPMIYDDGMEGGTTKGTLTVANDGFLMDCNLHHKENWPYCELQFQLDTPDKGFDLSTFDSISFDIDPLDSPEKAVKVYLMNFDPRFSKVGDPNSVKVNQIRYYPAQEEHPFKIPLQTFHVATWWITDGNYPPRYAATDLRNIVGIHISTDDSTTDGQQKFRVHSIHVQGKLFSITFLLAIILALWVVSACAFLAFNFLQAKAEMTLTKLQKMELERVNEALKLEKEELTHEAVRDQLTEINNRLGLRNYLFDQFSNVKNRTLQMGIIFMDIDHFKSINDTHGHETGDEVLKAFAKYIKQNIRNQDFFCRWGGEEFLIISENNNLEATKQLAEKLCESMHAYRWPKDIALTSSFGVAELHKGEDVSNLIKRVDQALYAAKKSGRDRVVVSN